MKYDKLKLVNSKGRVQVFINGRDLNKAIGKYERRFHKEPRPIEFEGYGEVRLEWFLTVAGEGDADDSLLLYACVGCGQVECWAMVFRVERNSDAVIWKDFENTYHSKSREDYWDYTDFGTFRFNPKDYDKQLARLQKKRPFRDFLTGIAKKAR